MFVPLYYVPCTLGYASSSQQAEPEHCQKAPLLLLLSKSLHQDFLIKPQEEPESDGREVSSGVKPETEFWIHHYPVVPGYGTTYH